MNSREDVEKILGNFVSWKAVPAACLKKVQKDFQTEEGFKNFLEWFQQSPAKKLLAARALVPEVMWEGYKLLQIQDLAEQNIFYAARKDMVDAFKQRYPAKPSRAQ